MKKKLVLGSMMMITLFACNEDNLEESIPSKVGEGKANLYEYNYDNSELLQISSILLKDNVKDDSRISMRSKGEKTSKELQSLELSYLGLGQEKDSLIVAVKDTKTGNAVILSKDKRTSPVIGYVDNLKSSFIPPQMKFYLSHTADGLKEEAREVMKSNEVSAELKNLDNNIDDYFMDIAKRKAENLRNDMLSRHREREDLNNILRNEDYVYVKGPLLKTQWGQTNSLIQKHYPNEIGVEGCVATAVGQVLNYWGDYVSEINFYNPFGGTYYDKFTTNSMSFPYKKSSTNHRDYEEVQYNISEQIINSSGSDGRGTYVILQSKGKDLRDFIGQHVKGVEVKDYTGLYNMVNSDEYYVTKSIDNGRPAIVSGDRHAWVCDGVVKVRVKRGVWPFRWTEHKYYIHMNWGWDGYGDGWFFSNGSDTYNSTGNGYKEIYSMLSIAP